MLSLCNRYTHLDLVQDEQHPLQKEIRSESTAGISCRPRITSGTLRAMSAVWSGVFSFSIVAGCAFAQSGNPAVTTGQYNKGRSAANRSEMILNTGNVTTQFGKLFSWAVDDWVFAQPLYLPNVQVGGKSTNLVFVATMNNTIYAFNADIPGAPPVWKTNVGTADHACVSNCGVPAPTANGCPSQSFTGSQLGILSTPVIDPQTGTLYAVSAAPAPGGYIHYLHAINVADGQERAGSPVQITASVPGTGSYDQSGGFVSLKSTSTDVQRTSLLLANGSVYAGFGNCGPDNNYWHGWVIGYSTANLATQTAAFNTTPNGGMGGVWQSARGIATDSSGNLYFTSGNGSTDTSGNYAMSFLKLTPSGTFAGSFPPPEYAALNHYDLDFSSSGPLLIPGTNLLVAGGKEGVLYMFDGANPTSPVQTWQGTTFCAALANNDPSAFNGCYQIRDLAFSMPYLYVWGANDTLRAFKFDPSTNRFATDPASQNSIKAGFFAAPLAVSANGSQAGTGIVWAVTPNGVLHAFDAANVATELWNSSQNASRDTLPSFAKFVEPTVANGRVYVATHSNQVVAYGILSDFTIALNNASSAVKQGNSITLPVSVTPLGSFSGSVALSISGLPSGATATFNPPSLTGAGSSNLTINTTSVTPVGTANLIIAGTAGSVTRSTDLALDVTAAVTDSVSPRWACCSFASVGSGLQIQFAGSDAESGMKSIVATQVQNAAVQVPSFTAGTRNAINFSSTVSGFSSYVSFQLTDVAGNTSYIDSAWIPTARQAGNTSQTFKLVKAVQKRVVLVNRNPGVKNLRVDVNGLDFKVSGLRDNETRTVDISSALAPGEGNTVVVTPLGKPGGSVVILIGSAIAP